MPDDIIRLKLIDILAVIPASAKVAKPRAGTERRNGETARRLTFYLYSYNTYVLDKLMEESGESQTAIVNAAIAFYAERGEYIEKLIKRSIKEVLHDLE